MRVLAVDPGKASGLALLSYVDGEVSIVDSRELDQDATADYVNAVLSGESRAGTDLRVACESFLITPKTGQNSQATWSLELIGVVKYLCHAYGLAPPKLQPPSRAKEFVPNDRLKALDIWHVGGAGHAKDALRHGVLYLVENCDWRPANLLVK